MKKAVTLSALGLLGVAIVVAAAVFRFGPGRSVSATTLPSASASAGAKPAGDIVVADAVKVKGRSVALNTTAVGTLVANESVEIAPELTRRVVKVFAKDGVRAKKGEVLFKLDDADLAATLGELTVKKKLAADVEARQKKLRAEGLSTEADYERARNDLELAAAQIASLGVTIARTSIRAPFDGRLGLRAVSEGAMVTPQTTLVTLHDDATLKVDFTLPERYGPLVKQGTTFTFHVEGQPDKVEAKVVAVEPQVDAETRSVRVRGLTDNAAGKLMPGSFVNVEFPLSQEAGGILVPTEAVIPSLGGHGVYRFVDGKAELVVVELGVRTPTEVQIAKGLSEGDTVLTSNILRLRPGIAVKLGTVE